MKAVKINHTGGPEVLEYVDLEDPTPDHGQVVVRTESISVNFSDLMMREGNYPVMPDLPTILGLEAAGVIEMVGEGVRDFVPGKRVVIITLGCYAEKVVVDALRSTFALAGASMVSGFQIFAEVFAKTEPPGIEPFRINYGRDRVEDLLRRIDAMIWPEMPFDTGWSAGTNDEELRDLVHYWRHEYDGFKVQDEMNELAHFLVPIEGEQVHVVRYRGTAERQHFLLLLLHGWPSTFLEFVLAAQILMNGIGGAPGFDLIVPSLPGFVFSEAPHTKGMHIGRIADSMHELMRELGYDHYGVQGGDWGAAIGVELAWILEKYWSWTDHGDDLWDRLDRDVVLTTVMLYWLPRRVLSAARIYYETRQMRSKDRSTGPVPIPTAYARFPKEPWGPPRSLVNPDMAANLVHYTEMQSGGHFPALEEPELYAKDVSAFFSKL